MRISKAVTFIVAALCVALPISGSILFVGLQFHPPSHVAVEAKVAGRPAFVKEEPDGYWEKLIDPIVLATIGLAIVTYLLFMSTAKMARDAKATGDRALTASTDATNTLVRIERPYVTVGGEYKRVGLPAILFITSGNQTYFRLEMGNYGKTAAVLTAFSVRFDTLANLRLRVSDVSRQDYPFHDLLAPGVKHKVIKDDIPISVDINSGTNIAYGACWYRSTLQQMIT